MKKKEVGEFLYRFYRKRTASFLANIYKASITAESKDIHKARLDVKKIIALCGLFELLDPSVFEKQGGRKLFRPLFRQAGKIREIQVNFLLLTNPQFHGKEYHAFMHWLREEERSAVLKFIQLVKKFREKELAATDKIIQKLCHSSSTSKLGSKTGAFIRQKALRVKRLVSESPGDKDIHKIRQNLKEMSTLTTLVCSIKPAKQFEMIISVLNKTEMMIGDWHDRLVLLHAIEQFLDSNAPVSKEEPDPVNELKQRLIQENRDLVLRILPEVNTILELVLPDQ